MYGVIIVLLVLASIMMVGIVLIQNSKGGGLTSNFQSSNQIMGVKRTADVLEKGTWILAIVMLFFSIVGSASISGKTGEQTKIQNVEDFAPRQRG